MKYEFIAIPDDEIPLARDPLFQHLVVTYTSETNKTASVWRAIPDDQLDFRPQEKTNTIRAILVHQILSERRFFGQFIGTREPSVDELLPTGERPTVQAYVERYIILARQRLPQLAAASAEWWLTEMPFFGGLSAAADLDVLAPGTAHLPPPDAGPDLAAAGRSASSSDLRPVRRCPIGGRRSDELGGSCGARWVEPYFERSEVHVRAQSHGRMEAREPPTLPTRPTTAITTGSSTRAFVSGRRPTRPTWGVNRASTPRRHSSPACQAVTCSHSWRSPARSATTSSATAIRLPAFSRRTRRAALPSPG